MSKVFPLASLLAVLAIGVIVTGCAKEQSGGQPSASPDASQGQPAAAAAHEGHDHAEMVHTDHSGHSEYEAALAELSPEDRALAEKQKTCPVSGEALGSMGKPYKVTVQGKDVMLCCGGCESKIKENPEQYLAKLSQ